jgi:hypothetical protein
MLPGGKIASCLSVGVPESVFEEGVRVRDDYPDLLLPGTPPVVRLLLAVLLFSCRLSAFLLYKGVPPVLVHSMPFAYFLDRSLL